MNHLDAVSAFRLLIILPLALTIIIVVFCAAAIHEILVALVVLGDHVRIVFFVLLLCQDFLPSCDDLVHFFFWWRRSAVRVAPVSKTTRYSLVLRALIFARADCLGHTTRHEIRL